MQSVQEEAALAQKCGVLCEKFQEATFDDEKNIKVTISVGALMAQKGQYYDLLYRYADQALYRAKEKGRNRFEIAT